jgi:hypothetical protein
MTWFRICDTIYDISPTATPFTAGFIKIDVQEPVFTGMTVER